jgi:myo-inositol-hexaphosphate 3-phosphohydrolase
MQYVVKNGQGIYDVAVLLYGDAQYSVKLCVDNDITITDSIEGLTLTYDDKIKREVVSASIRQQNTPKQPDNSYYIKQTQSVWDLVLQFGYGLNRAVEFTQMADIDITSTDIGGQIIQVTKIPNNIPFSTIFATQAPSEAPVIPSYLLLEDGFYLLQEDGSKFIL